MLNRVRYRDQVLLVMLSRSFLAGYILYYANQLTTKAVTIVWMIGHCQFVTCVIIMLLGLHFNVWQRLTDNNQYLVNMKVNMNLLGRLPSFKYFTKSCPNAKFYVYW